MYIYIYTCIPNLFDLCKYNVLYVAVSNQIFLCALSIIIKINKIHIALLLLLCTRTGKVRVREGVAVKRCGPQHQTICKFYNNYNDLI